MLNADRLATAMKDAVKAQFGELDEVNFTKFAKAISESIIAEFTANAVVSVSGGYTDKSYPPPGTVPVIESKTVNSTGGVA